MVPAILLIVVVLGFAILVVSRFESRVAALERKDRSVEDLEDAIRHARAEIDDINEAVARRARRVDERFEKIQQFTRMPDS